MSIIDKEMLTDEPLLSKLGDIFRFRIISMFTTGSTWNPPSGTLRHFLATTSPTEEVVWREWKSESWREISRSEVPPEVLEEMIIEDLSKKAG